MRFIWDDAKRRSNLRDHEIDFVDAERVFAGLTSTFEDDRFSYDERRFVTLGLLGRGASLNRTHGIRRGNPRNLIQTSNNP
jgi:uncharacterized DUF497 family protein